MGDQKTKSNSAKPITLGIHFGALADPISKQLKKQGFKFKKKDVSFFDKELDAITRLKFASLIPDGVATKAYGKLYKNIERHVVKENKIK